MRLKSAYLPAIGAVGVVVLIGIVGVGLDLEQFDKLELTSPAVRHVGEDALVTSASSAYVRWAAMFLALMVAWILVCVVGVMMIVQRKPRLSGQGAPTRFVWVVVPAIALLGVGMEAWGISPWAHDLEQTLVISDVPGFTFVRNCLGWLAGAIVVIAISHLVTRDAVEGKGDLRESLAGLAEDIRALRTLMLATTFSLAVGVAQVSTLTRMKIIQETSWSQERGWADANPVALPAHFVDLERTVTLGAGILFSAVALCCFLPALALFERARIGGIQARADTVEAEEESGNWRKPLGLERSLWSFATESVALLLPVVSGLVLNRL